MGAFLLVRGIPFVTRLKQAFKLFQTHLSWTIWPFLLGVMSWLPTVLLARELGPSPVAYSEPRLVGVILNLALGGYLTYVALSQLFLPRTQGTRQVRRRILHAFEWLLIVPLSVFFGAVPALDAQTRLMLGKYMEFWVTVKKRG
jgi:hypothetical protein